MTAYAYNGIDLVVGLNYNGGKSVGYSYNAAGDLVLMDDWTGATTFEVDLLGRITRATDAKGNAVGYGYDGVGNQVSVEYPDGWAEDYAYDGRGNLVKDAHKVNNKTSESVYSYDETNKMSKGTNGQGESSEYLYDGLGALVRNTWNIKKNAYGYHDATTVVKSFVVDYTSETMEPLVEQEAPGVSYKYVYGNDRLSVNVTGVANGAGHIIEGGEIRLYYHMDLRGTARYLTSPVSKKVESWTHYNEWGEITHNAVVKTGQREFDMVKRYATHDYDQVLGLYYAKARFYDASGRRFASMDPILDPSSHDLRAYVADPGKLVQYLYVRNAPLTNIDPLGLDWLYINGVKAAEVSGTAADGFFIEMTALTNAMKDMRLITSLEKKWEDITKTAVYTMKAGFYNTIFEFNTISGEGNAKARSNTKLEEARPYFMKIESCDFKLNASSGRVEINLATIKSIFEDLGLKFSSWEVVDYNSLANDYGKNSYSTREQLVNADLVELIARIIYGEQTNPNDNGQEAIAWIMANRVLTQNKGEFAAADMSSSIYSIAIKDKAFTALEKEEKNLNSYTIKATNDQGWVNAVRIAYELVSVFDNMYPVATVIDVSQKNLIRQALTARIGISPIGKGTQYRSDSRFDSGHTKINGKDYFDGVEIYSDYKSYHGNTFFNYTYLSN